jgi:YgiT-type zinc finger domain-containing protein
MDCICGAKAKRINTRVELYGGDIVVNNVEALYCPKCNMEVLTSEQASLAQEKMRSALPGHESFSVQKKLTKTGNSLSISIAKEIVEYMGLQNGSEVRVKPINRRRLIIDVA